MRHRIRRRNRRCPDAAPLSTPLPTSESIGSAEIGIEKAAASDTPKSPESDAEAATASLADLAHQAMEYLRNFLQLLLGETALASSSLKRLLISAFIVPAIVLSAWFAINALLAALLQRWLQSWIAAIAIVLVFDIAIIALFGLLMLRWWRDLSLPRSRAAIARLLDRPQ